MFTKCLFCHADLGRNDQLETFPVGKRIAFDAAKGRLWVVCRSCTRWNLTPLEERWEAIERAQILIERLKAVAQSDRIALYRHPSGLELVRIGGANWRETAYWRYAKKLTQRRTQTDTTRRTANLALQIVPRIFSGSLMAAGTAIVATVGWTGVGAAGAGLVALGYLRGKLYRAKPLMRLNGEDEADAFVRRWHLRHAMIIPASDGAIKIEVDSDTGPQTFEHADAVRVLGHALVEPNRRGANEDEVGMAVRTLERAGSAEGFLANVVRTRRSNADQGLIPLKRVELPSGRLIRDLPELTRISLEIATHEELERLALEGELETLEKMWRDAEEIAAIADSLLIPEPVLKAWRRLRGD
jgi:hypothetical protein